MIRRNVVIGFRATAKERRAFEILAAREDMTLSGLMRTFVREGIERRGIYAVGLADLLNLGEANERE